MADQYLCWCGYHANLGDGKVVPLDFTGFSALWFNADDGQFKVVEFKTHLGLRVS
jgi:hypothetical protein